MLDQVTELRYIMVTFFAKNRLLKYDTFWPITDIRDGKCMPGSPTRAQNSGRLNFRGAHAQSAGFMPGPGEAITIRYTLAVGLRQVLDRRWSGSPLGAPDFRWGRAGLRPGFWGKSLHL